MAKKWIFGWLAVLVIALPFTPARAQNETIQWLTYEEAQKKQSEGSSRKFFLYFYADWCSYCRKLEGETFKDTSVISYINDNYTPVLINMDRQRDVAAQYNVTGVPDLRFISSKGENIARWAGYIKASKLLPLLKYIHSESYQTMDYAAFLKKEKAQAKQ